MLAFLAAVPNFKAQSVVSRASFAAFATFLFNWLAGVYTYLMHLPDTLIYMQIRGVYFSKHPAVTG